MISLIRAFVVRLQNQCSICRRTENTQIKLHGCARWSELSLFAYIIRGLFPRYAWMLCLVLFRCNSHIPEVRICDGMVYFPGASCANSFNQDYGIIELPRPSLFRKPPAIKCIWTFTAREGDSLSIKIHEFSVDKSRRCFRGYLEVSIGATINKAKQNPDPN